MRIYGKYQGLMRPNIRRAIHYLPSRHGTSFFLFKFLASDEVEVFNLIGETFSRAN